MRTLPSAEELVGIVAESLRDGATNWTTYQCRIAANALGIAERELALSAKFDSAIRLKLERFALTNAIENKNELDLNLAIRSEEFDVFSAEAMNLLWMITRAEIAIDNPKYSTLVAIESGYDSDI